MTPLVRHDPLLIRGARVIDPSRDVDHVEDVFIENGCISDSARNPENCAVFDGAGLWLLPGLTDMHVHLREPGHEQKETVLTGTQAAARGGMTAVCAMPNTSPAMDNQSVIELVLSRPRFVDVHPIAAITRGRAGMELSDFHELKQAGAVALSDDGDGVPTAGLMRRALEYARLVDLPIIQHAEDKTLSCGGVMHEGERSTRLGLPGSPWTAEAVMVSRDLLLLEQIGGKLHVAHVSCRQTLELIRRAKDKGLNVTCEVCPHHLILDDGRVADYDPVSKVNPPLRESADVEAMIEALARGLIDVIASDHAPHTLEAKERDYQEAPFGISGVETSLALVHTHLVKEGLFSPLDLVDRFAVRPRRILALDPLTTRPGSRAHLTLFDPTTPWEIRGENFTSCGHNTPFDGHPVEGWVTATLVDGAFAHLDGVLGKPRLMLP